MYHSAFFMTKTAPLFALVKALAVSCDLRSSRLLSPTLWPYALIVHTVLITMKCQVIVQYSTYIHFFRALHTHTHGFIYIYKPDTNSNTVLPCARPKHIHITYHSFTILTHIYIYLFIFLVLRANKSSTCSLFPELVPLISQSFSEANFLVQAVKLDPLGLVTSLDTTLSLQCQSQCVSCLDMSRSSAWSDSTTASQVSALSSAHASGKSPQPKVQFGSMRINLVQNARCCWSITKGWRGMPLISTSGSLKGIKRMAARELSKIFWCPACFSHASALL